MKITKSHRKGSLTIVGTGIIARFHISAEAISALKFADKVFYVVTDILTERWIRKLQPTAQSLLPCYADGKRRIESYTEMVKLILAEVRKGSRVCAVFYGHPGVGVYPAYRAIKIARAEGFEAHMRPAISAKDCLFADLGIDPLTRGCQSFEATDFVLSKRIFDPRSDLILWQIGVLGNDDYRASGTYDLRHLSLLQKVLLRKYPSNHNIVLYCADTLSIGKPSLLKVRLNKLSKASFHGGYTMYVPPLNQTPPDKDILKKLGY